MNPVCWNECLSCHA
jgi:cyclopropane-fatty-acyl-phospholipid synthase